jgi:hypothetical protein
MTDEFAINIIEQYRKKPTLVNEIETVEEAVWLDEALDMAIKALEQESCDDTISRQAVLDIINFEDKWLLDAKGHNANTGIAFGGMRSKVSLLPFVTSQPKTGHCKDCKYFEYDSVAKVDGIPLIVAHEICSRWGDGCKTKEDGYCFMFEPQESEDKK